MPQSEPPCHPIIYVRGYAMTQAEQDNTAADPFCGFNLGSTVYRATPDRKKPPQKFVFESPVVRLMSEFGYEDVYEDGRDMGDPEWRGRASNRSIVVYRYYDEASTLLGSGETPPIEEFSKGLSDLILRVRDRVCANPDNKTKPGNFRCYLVAHSMGGLVCRAFLQNPALGDDEARRCVDKLFTYATPHNGIEMGGVNVPRWLSSMDMDNFNQKRMSKYLNLTSEFKATRPGRVDWLPPGTFDAQRVFCLVGTNRGDYEAAMGLSRAFAGRGSDGLVRVENATLWARDAKGEATPCAAAYTYRSHSGWFGIVNGEEGYQNLRRFLFGDLRVDLWADVEAAALPDALAAKEKKKPGSVDALYQFELTAAPRGMRRFLTRRVAEEDSVACRGHQELSKPKRRSVYLSTVFLDRRASVTGTSTAYGVNFAVRVPDYEVAKAFWPDEHYEGGDLYREGFVFELTDGGTTIAPAWEVICRRRSAPPGANVEPVAMEHDDAGRYVLRVPFGNDNRPGIKGRLRLVVTPWNR